MAYFRETSTIINYAMGQLLANEDICKLVHYYPEEVSFKYDPREQPDVEDKSILLMERFYPLPKTPDPEDEHICFVTVNLTGDTYLDGSTGYIKVVLLFDVISHLDCWCIKNGYRPLEIVHEIDTMFNNKMIKDLSINKAQTIGLTLRSYASKFYGYQLAYEIRLNSNIVCDLETGLWI